MENQKPPTFSTERESANSLISSVGVAEQVVQPVLRRSLRSVFQQYPLQMLMVGTLIILTIIGTAYAVIAQDEADTNASLKAQPSSKFSVQDVTLRGVFRPDAFDLTTIQSLSINGQLRANNSLVLAPTTQPTATSASTGQLYYDETGNVLAYYNGTQFISVAGSNDLEALRSELTAVNTRISAIPPVPPIPAAVTIPSDLATLGADNTFTGTNSFSASLSANSLTAGSLTTTGNTSLQGSLTVTGSTLLGPTTISSLVLTSPLDVASGGTGASSFTTNGVLIGQGTGPVTSLAAGAGNLCLMSNAGNTGLEFDTCPGGSGSGVTSLNGLDGTLTLSNATGVGTTLTIDDATTTTKGIASFNTSNFSVSGGVVNTIQNISTGASPTFAGVTASSLTSATNQNLTLDAAGTGSLYLGGYDCSTFGNTGKLTTNASGQVVCANDTNTTYLPGDGLALTTGEFSVLLQGTGGVGSGLKVDNTGLALQNCSTDGYLLKFNTVTGWYCAADSEGTGDGEGITAIDGDNALSVSGTSSTATLTLVTEPNRGLNVSASGLGLQTCADDQILKYDTTNGWECATDTDTNTDTNTIYTPGNGIAIDGSNIISTLLQTTNSGLRFNGSGELTLASCTLDQVLKNDGSGGWVCANDIDTDTDTNTTYLPGDGLALTTGEFSVLLQGTGGVGSGLKVDNTGLALQNCSTDGYLLKFNTVTGWYCAADSEGTGDGEGITAIDGDNALSVSGTSSTATLTLVTEPNRGLNVSASGLGLQTCADDQILKYDTTNGWECATDTDTNTDTNTIYTPGNGIAIDGSNIISTLLQTTNSGLRFNGSGELTLASCTLDQVLKNDGSGGWVCANDIDTDTDTTGVTISGTATDGSLTKFNSSGEIMNSNLAESGTTNKTLTYTGNLIANAATGFTGNLLDLRLNNLSKFRVSETGNTTVGGTLTVQGATVTGSGALTLSSGTNTDLTLQGGGTGVVQVNDNLNLSSGSQYQINGSQISSAALSNDSSLAKLNATNVFTNTNTIRPGTNSASAFVVQNATSTDVFSVDTVNRSIAVGTPITYNLTTYTVSGGFANAVHYATTSTVTPHAIASADIDGDGDKDVAIGHGTNVGVYKNNGNGTFAAPTNTNLSVPVKGIDFGDVNGDGDADMAVTVDNGSSSAVDVFNNNGSGVFSIGGYAANTGLHEVFLRDLNADGDLDMIALSDLGRLSVYTNNGSGGYGVRAEHNTPGGSIPVRSDMGTINGDSNADAIVWSNTGAFYTFMGNGTGGFGGATTLAISATNVEQMRLSDVDGDLDKDLVTVEYGGSIKVYKNNGTGTFTLSGTFSVPGTSSGRHTISVADFDLDGDMDIFHGAFSGADLLRNDGTGVFTYASSAVSSSDVQTSVVNDFNGDTKIDVIVGTMAAGSGSIGVLLNAVVFTPNITPTPSTASITAASSANAALVLQGASGQAVDLLRIQDSSASPLFVVARNGNIGVGDVMNLADSVHKLNVAGSASLTGALNLGVNGTTAGAIVFNSASGAGTVTLQGPAAQGASSYTLSIPTLTANDTLCLETAGNCSGLTLDGTDTPGALTMLTGAGQLKATNLAESGTTAKTLTFSGNAVINAGSGFTGNLIDAQLNGLSRLSVSETGALTTAGVIRSNAGFSYNGTAGAGTSCSGGQFLQNQVVQGGIVTGGTCATAGSGLQGSGTNGQIGVFDINGALQGSANILFNGTTASLTLGSSTLIGNLLFHDGTGFMGTIRIASGGLSQNTIYVLPAVNGGVVEICTSAGNCIPHGNAAGDMLYWDGDSWALIPAGNNGDRLEFCSGVPVWGGNASVSTAAASSITYNGATSGGTIVGACSGIIERGVVYATTTNPTTANNKAISGDTTATYTATMTGLSQLTTYYARAYVTTGEGTVYGNQVSFTTPERVYSIGETGPGGGKVFYDKGSYSSGWRYLEAAPSNQASSIAWCSNTTTLLGASGTAIGTGKTNTTTAAATCSSGAIRIAEDYAGGGYTDWFLPSLNELLQLYNQRAAVGGLTPGAMYWSSSESSSTNAYILLSDDGFTGNDPKGVGQSYRYARAIRQF